MGRKIGLTDWVTFGWHTEKAVMVIHGSYGSWFPLQFLKRPEQINDNFYVRGGRLEKYLKKDGYWLLDNKNWETRKDLARKKKRKNDLNQTVLMPTGDERIEFRDMGLEKERRRRRRVIMKRKIKQSMDGRKFKYINDIN